MRHGGRTLGRSLIVLNRARAYAHPIWGRRTTLEPGKLTQGWRRKGSLGARVCPTAARRGPAASPPPTTGSVSKCWMGPRLSMRVQQRGWQQTETIVDAEEQRALLLPNRLVASKFSNQEVSKTRLRHLEVAPHEPRTKKMKAFGDGAWSNFHFPKVPPPGGLTGDRSGLK